MTYQGWLKVFSELIRTLRFVWHPAPHMPILIQSFKISNFRKVKKGRGRFGMFANLDWFKECFLSSGGQNTSFDTPYAYCSTIFQKIFFRQISTFSTFGRNSAIWDLQHVLFLAQGSTLFFWYPTCLP